MRRLIRFLWRPAPALWGTVAILVLYPLSVGPACWLIWNVHLPRWIGVLLALIYSPLIWAITKSKALTSLADAYAGLWHKPGGQPTTDVPGFDEPPFFAAVAGTLLSAWLILNVVPVGQSARRQALRDVPSDRCKWANRASRQVSCLAQCHRR